MPLVSIDVESIYKNKQGKRVSLPPRMAHCTPDMKAAIRAVSTELTNRGGHLFLSDLFRSYEMQLQSHLDFVNKKKSAFSPPPGGSMHEAGRALDLDLESLEISLADFWPIAKANGLFPIVSRPDSTLKESWHFDCRGSHDRVYRYYDAGKGTNMKPYQAMSASAILSVEIKVDRFGPNQQAAAIQSALIRLGQELGNIDGSLGRSLRMHLRMSVFRLPIHARCCKSCNTCSTRSFQKRPGSETSTMWKFPNTSTSRQAKGTSTKTPLLQESLLDRVSTVTR